MTHRENRSSNGRFEQDIDDMMNRSIVSGIIHDELEKFWTSTQKRSAKVDEEPLDEDTIVEIAAAKKS